MSRQSRLVGYLRTESSAFSLELIAASQNYVFVYDDMATSYVDRTTESVTDASLFTPIDDGANVGDALYIGQPSMFAGIYVHSSGGVAGVGGTVAWEYWDGATWSALSGVTDNTTGLTAAPADTVDVTWTVPGDWATTTVNGESGQYWIRARVPAGGTYSTAPQIDEIAIISPDTTVSLTDGDWFPDELAAHITAQVVAAHAMFANLVCSIDTATGIFSIVLDSGETGTLTWTDTGLRDWLRFSGATTALSSVATSGSRVHKLGLYPYHTAITDLPTYPDNGSQTRADGGKVWTVSYAELVEHRIELLFKGGPRSAVYTEYSALLELFRLHTRLGKAFRWYPDSTVTAEYAEVSEPYGYHQLKAQLPLGWDPTPFVAQWYDRFQFEMDCFVDI